MTFKPVELLALSFMKGMTSEVAIKMVEILGDLHEFYAIDAREARRTLGTVNEAFFDLLSSRESALIKAAEELRFIEKHNIRMLSILNADDYPSRLSECVDAPVNLFVLGDANLSDDRMLAVVGTRKASDYGNLYTNKIIEELHEGVGQTTIVSGLAYGIDKTAHIAALRLKMPTVAVVAHGLSMIYPAAHRGLASEIIKSGGALVSEYMHNIRPFRPNFLERNRIIAGLCDAVFVAESPLKGGALNTAAHARNYNREVLALPGRATDVNSLGCNKLISSQMALLATTGKEIAESVQWDLQANFKNPKTVQTSLFDEYDGATATVIALLRTQLKPVTVDFIVNKTALSTKDVMASLGELDMDGILSRLPGAKYALI